MPEMNKLLSDVILMLNNSVVCLSSEVRETNIFPDGNFIVKIRAKLRQDCQLQIRFYYNQGHYDYSYQLYEGNMIARWDNAEHFPHLNTFPHHFHSKDGKITESPLSGDPFHDFPIVLREIEQIVISIE